MKVCFLTANFPPEATGGTEQVVTALLRELRGRGVDVEVVHHVEPSGERCGQLVERGMLRPGDELVSMNLRHKARVRADGTLVANDVKGSIHQVGAHMEGAPSCNGWTYWTFKRDGKQVPIDVLRQQIRSEMQ